MTNFLILSFLLCLVFFSEIIRRYAVTFSRTVFLCFGFHFKLFATNPAFFNHLKPLPQLNVALFSKLFSLPCKCRVSRNSRPFSPVILTSGYYFLNCMDTNFAFVVLTLYDYLCHKKIVRCNVCSEVARFANLSDIKPTEPLHFLCNVMFVCCTFVNFRFHQLLAVLQQTQAVRLVWCCICGQMQTIPTMRF